MTSNISNDNIIATMNSKGARGNPIRFEFSNDGTLRIQHITRDDWATGGAMQLTASDHRRLAYLHMAAAEMLGSQ